MLLWTQQLDLFFFGVRNSTTLFFVKQQLNFFEGNNNSTFFLKKNGVDVSFFKIYKNMLSSGCTEHRFGISTSLRLGAAVAVSASSFSCSRKEADLVAAACCVD